MADIQAAGEIIKWAVNGVTILLMIIAASLAIKKKNNIKRIKTTRMQKKRIK